MINSIYVDNYRCFSQFEYKPSGFELLLGENGSGKSSIFEVLEALQEVVTTAVPTDKVFPAETLTGWTDESVQTFRLGMNRGQEQFEYELIIEHGAKRVRNRITSETLSLDGETLYQFDGSEAHLFRDDASVGPVFPFAWSRSAIPTIPERDDNKSLTWFRDRLRDVYIFSPDPPGMETVSSKETARPDRSLSDIVSWLRHLQQESVDLATDIRDSLRDVIDGFASYRLEKVSESSREMKVQFEFRDVGTGSLSRSFELPFDLLSDGQRNLFALFAILHAAVREGTTLCIDEPDNFVALRELQPWLGTLKEKAEDTGCQCLLISHHPEFIDYLAADHGTWLFREETGETRAKKFEWDGEGGFGPSEVIARGWAG